MNEKELRELDAWIAENLFGFTPVALRDLYADGRKRSEKEYVIEWLDISRTVPLYSTDPAAAMEVLKRCCHESAEDVRVNFIDDVWLVGIEGKIWTEAKTIELAIAKFAKALFSKEETK